MSNAKKLNIGAKSFSRLSGTEKFKLSLQENSKSPCEIQNRNKNDVELDALSKVKMDPAVLKAEITLNVVPSTTNYNSQLPINEQLRQKETPKLNITFEDSLLSMYRKEQLKLSTQQCALLMVFAQNLKSQSALSQKSDACGFCKNNGHSVTWYKSHILKDKRGRVQCPNLRALRCPLCGDTGDHAHTAKYCPYYK